jgi:hypothetical protein
MSDTELRQLYAAAGANGLLVDYERRFLAANQYAQRHPSVRWQDALETLDRVLKKIDVTPQPSFALEPAGEHHWVCGCAKCRPDAHRIKELYKRRNSEAKITM